MVGDHEPGVLALAAEVWLLDSRTSRPAIAEPLGPDLVKLGPVTLKIPHDDADAYGVGGQRSAGGGEDRLEVVEDLSSLGSRLADGVVQRVGPEHCGHVD